MNARGGNVAHRHLVVAFGCALFSATTVAQTERPLDTSAVVSLSVHGLIQQDPSAGGAPAEAAVPDLFTGTLTTEIALEMPSGRGGMTPPLALRYRSTQLNSWVGTGWDLRVGAIERDVRSGLDYTADRFVLDDG